VTDRDRERERELEREREKERKRIPIIMSICYSQQLLKVIQQKLKD